MGCGTQFELDRRIYVDKSRIDIADYSGIVFLTGAGISAASGIRTYRGPDGLWNDATLVRLSDGGTFRSDPLAVWRFWSETQATFTFRPAHRRSFA